MLDAPIIPTYRELRTPVTAQFALTYRCNNLCNYCYNSVRSKKEICNGMDLKSALKVADEIIKNELFEVVLTGGEPLYRRDILYPLAQTLSSENIDVTVNTNLTLINQEDLKRIKKSGVSSVFGSVPSYDEETYNKITQSNNYKKAIKSLEQLLKADIPIAINMVVTKLNLRQVYDTGKFFNNMGINVFCATPASPCSFMSNELMLNPMEVTRTLDALLALRDEFKMRVDAVEPIPRCVTGDSEKYEHFFRRDCAAGKMTISIDPNGEVMPCTHIDISYGNLLKDDLRTIWKRMNNWRDGSYAPDECGQCREVEVCSLGCREAARIVNGSYKCLDPWAMGKLNKNRKIYPETPLDRKTSLMISKGIRFRGEGDGYFVYDAPSHSILHMDKNLFGLLTKLNSRKNFTLEDVENEFGDNSNICTIIKFLNNRGLVVRW